MKHSIPDSADDLLIKDGKILMRSLSVYEVLRRFSHIIRLTPFRFEDFAAALIADDQSPLIAEIHIQLLRTLLREDRQQQTWLGPPDIRDAVNIYLQLADHLNWPAALRIYLSGDPGNNSLILDRLGGTGIKTYPFNATVDIRLDVLEQLCDQFLLSNLAREEIVNGSNSIEKHDIVCRLCSKANGDLVPCGTCTAVYHLKCSDPPLENYPDLDCDETYSCAICRSNHITGVSDCIDDNEKNGNFKRHDSLGTDNSGRKYWFLVRRLFVVDDEESDVRYYTTTKQLEEVIANLEENSNDHDLIESLEGQDSEIKRQMKITEDLYQTVLKDYKKADGSYTHVLGQDNGHRNYTNHYSNSTLALGKNQHSDRDVMRSLGNKFSLSGLNSFKWSGAINGHLTTLTLTVKSSILRFEAMLPTTFTHPCWQTHKPTWIKSVNYAQKAEDYAIALSQLESCIKPVLFRSTWYESVGFTQLFRSTFAEREELKKTDRQPRGFERREWFSQDFELSYRLGTMVKFSSKLKPVKHQVWKQKGEEYRLTGLNGWYWQSCTHKLRLRTSKKKTLPENLMKKHNSIKTSDEAGEDAKVENDVKTSLSTLIGKVAGDLKSDLSSNSTSTTLKETVTNNSTPKTNANSNSNSTPNTKSNIIKLCKPKMPPCHDFLTKGGRRKSIFVLPQAELHKLARSGGLKETKSFSYTAKQNNYVWPYGMTPRPTFRTCWLYRNRLSKNTIQDVALQLRIIHACLRWEDLQVRPPASGHNVIVTDDSTITIQLLKKRDKLPYLNHSEYLIKKVVTPIEQPTKYRKVGVKKATPSARSGLRARRQTEEEEEKGPTTEEVWVSEDQLELWEIKQFDEKIERQNQLMRERALREEAEKRRRIEEERRRKAEQERRRRIEEETRKARLSQAALNTSTPPITPQTVRLGINVGGNQQQKTPTTPVLRYFRTEQGQIIRLPASYLERGTPLILRHVGPGPNQTNTYIIRPLVTPTNNAATSTSSTTNSTSALTTTVATTSTQEGPNNVEAKAASVKAEPSVGTVVNEIAHDQHASET